MIFIVLQPFRGAGDDIAAAPAVLPSASHTREHTFFL